MDSPGRLPAFLRMMLLSLAFSSPSFVLGSFSFLHAYALRGMGHNDLIAPISNLTWGMAFLGTMRLLTPEPYLRISFYSFISPTLVFASYKAYHLLCAG